MNSVSSSISLLFATLCLIGVVSAEAPGPAPGPNLISKACERAPDKSLCIDLLNSNPDSKKSDLKQLTFIALQIASKNAAETSSMLRTALLEDDNKIIDTSEERIVSDCSEAYSSITDLIDNSIDALVTGHADDVEKEVNAAIAAVDTCSASINRLKGQSLEVSQKNRIVRKLCENALSVYHVFTQKK